jgi:FixJ family two-component response regulator
VRNGFARQSSASLESGNTEAKMPEERALISIVDDDESVQVSTMDLVKSMGFAATTFPHAEAFLASQDVQRTDCLIADMRMPGMTGLELFNRLVQAGNPIPTILLTAFPDERDRMRAQRSGVTCYLAKPFNDEDLLACVHSALKSRETD